MRTTSLRRTGAFLASAALLASLTVSTVAAPAAAAKPKCDGKVATIIGTSKGETLRGTKKADVIVAKGGKDIIYGKGGKDTICGGDGGDVLKGGDGLDTLRGGAGADTLNGGSGVDACYGGPGFDRIFSCNEPATTGLMSITTDTTLTAAHKGEIVIDANDVSLDCDGYTVTGPGSGTGIKVFGRNGVTIVGCHVTKFKFGIYVVDSSGISIRSNSANHNEQGMAIENSIAILRNNVANRNLDWGYILMQDMAGTQAIGNRADYNRHGFALGSSHGALLESNVARWNHQSNIDLYRSHDNTLRFNKTKGRSIGFHLGESTGNVLKSNTATGHTSGFHVFDSTDNTLRGNAAKNNREGFSDNGRSGSGTKGTDNTYLNNVCVANQTKSIPKGLC